MYSENHQPFVADISDPCQRPCDMQMRCFRKPLERLLRYVQIKSKKSENECSMGSLTDKLVTPKDRIELRRSCEGNGIES